MNNIKTFKVKSNGYFSIIKDCYNKKQHPNQQEGLDLYLDIIDHSTGNINSVKLYKNSKGLYFKKNGSWYINNFKDDFVYIPFQMIKI